MMIETLIENPPTVVNSEPIPAFARDYVDIWGNIKKTPVKAIEQARGPDFIRIYIYRADPGFYYGFQLKLKKLILQKEANIKDEPCKTEDEARQAARRTIVAFVGSYSKKLVDLYLTFDKICYNQPELF
jgi:hypothetical protein